MVRIASTLILTLGLAALAQAECEEEFAAHPRHWASTAGIAVPKNVRNGFSTVWYGSRSPGHTEKLNEVLRLSFDRQNAAVPPMPDRTAPF